MALLLTSAATTIQVIYGFLPKCTTSKNNCVTTVLLLLIYFWFQIAFASIASFTFYCSASFLFMSHTSCSIEIYESPLINQFILCQSLLKNTNCCTLDWLLTWKCVSTMTEERLENDWESSKQWLTQKWLRDDLAMTYQALTENMTKK
jgi:hypothetical protein